MKIEQKQNINVTTLSFLVSAVIISFLFLALFLPLLVRSICSAFSVRSLRFCGFIFMLLFAGSISVPLEPIANEEKMDVEIVKCRQRSKHSL